MKNYWSGTYGQESVKLVLGKIISSRKIPHAFLFSGAEGTGKEFFALRFIESLTINAVDDNNADKIKRKIETFSEPYIKYIFPLPRGKNETDSSGPIEKLNNDEIQTIREETQKKINNPYYKISIPKASNIKISSIRDIKKFLSYNYGDIPYRSIIISDAHLMNEEAQNALLKSIEEPPDGIIFILITSFPSMLRETILSRCWSIHFQPLTNSDLLEILVNNFDIDITIAKKIVPFAGGSINKSLNLYDSDFEDMLEKAISILRYSFGRKISSALDEFAPIISQGDLDSIKLIIQLIISWLNDFQKIQLGCGNYYFNSYPETLQKFYKRFPTISVKETVARLDRLASIVQNNININLIVINIILELSAIVNSK